MAKAETIIIDNRPDKEGFVSMSVRMRKSRVDAIHGAKAGMKYRISLSALLERAIDLLVEDLKTRGELNG